VAKPRVNSEEPDSRNAVGTFVLVNGSSISANPTYRHRIQVTSSVNRNIGAPAARIRSRRCRLPIRQVSIREQLSTRRATTLLIDELRFCGISSVLMTLDPVTSSRHRPPAKPSQAMPPPVRAKSPLSSVYVLSRNADRDGESPAGQRYAQGMEMEPGSPPPAATAPAGTAPTGPVWAFLIKPRWLGWHVLMVVCFWGMLWLGDWQFHRAMSGNALSWAYTFEWPLFAGFAVVFWARTIRDEFRILRTGSVGGGHAYDYAEPSLPGGVAAGAAAQPSYSLAQQAADEAEDPELAAWNAHLARLNSEVKGHGKWHGLR
jgi:hypothetical protein